MADLDPNAQTERSFETGEDEFFKAGSENMYNNMKRTFDAYQNLELELARKTQVHFDALISRSQSAYDKVVSDAQAHDNQLKQLSIQAMQNAVETANMVGKKAIENLDINHQQTVDHRDVATTANLGVGVMAETVAAAVAKSVDASVTPVLSTLVANIAALTDMIKTISVAPKAA